MSDLAHVLIVGNGGREHALAWKLAQSPRVGKVSVAPGNAGTPNNVPISATDIDGLLKWALEHKPDLTVVGPEAPLALGIVDRFEAAGLKIFGPTQAAAQIETSKVFAKQFMQRHGIPTAPFQIFDDPHEALRYLLLEGDQPLAIKADGLAAGKGVYMTNCAHDAEMAVRALMIDRTLGDAGARIVIEKALKGVEISLLALSDGENVAMLPLAQDHKRVFDSDMGPNTGGMGAYSPVDNVLYGGSQYYLISTAIKGLEQEGIPFKGVLFAGLIVNEQRPAEHYVLEFNCRFGDPETQAVLPTLSQDLFTLLETCTSGDFRTPYRFLSLEATTRQHAATVVMASGGYPGEYETGKVITGLDQVPSDVIVFHAGTRREGDQIATAGGRVLSVTGTGETLQAAVDRAYAGVRAIHFEGAHYRTDIGAKGLGSL